jgi:hypothetical protein
MLVELETCPEAAADNPHTEFAVLGEDWRCESGKNRAPAECGVLAHGYSLGRIA